MEQQRKNIVYQIKGKMNNFIDGVLGLEEMWSDEFETLINTWTSKGCNNSPMLATFQKANSGIAAMSMSNLCKTGLIVPLKQESGNERFILIKIKKSFVVDLNYVSFIERKEEQLQRRLVYDSLTGRSFSSLRKKKFVQHQFFCRLVINSWKHCLLLCSHSEMRSALCTRKFIH